MRKPTKEQENEAERLMGLVLEQIDEERHAAGKKPLPYHTHSAFEWVQMLFRHTQGDTMELYHLLYAYCTKEMPPPRLIRLLWLAGMPAWPLLAAWYHAKHGLNKKTLK